MTFLLSILNVLEGHNDVFFLSWRVYSIEPINLFFCWNYTVRNKGTDEVHLYSFYMVSISILF